jgi:ribosomal protein L24
MNDIICPNCKKQTRVGIEIVKNEKLRVCRKCKKQI